MYLPFIFLILFFVPFVFSFENVYIDDESLNNILQSDDINEKIDYLIQIRSDNNVIDWLKYISFMPLVIIAMLFRTKLAKFTSYFFPCNLFLFGKEIDRYERRLDVRSKLFWIIFVGLILSIIGSYIVSRIP